jgi:hypothetical protein
MNPKNAKPSATPPVQVVLERRIEIGTVFTEVNRLRGLAGLEEAGTLSLATTLFRHYHESHNPRVAEALTNTGHDWCAQGRVVEPKKPAADKPAAEKPAASKVDETPASG